MKCLFFWLYDSRRCVSFLHFTQSQKALSSLFFSSIVQHCREAQAFVFLLFVYATQFCTTRKRRNKNDESAVNNAGILNFFSNHSFSQFHNDSLAAASIQRWLKKQYLRGNFHECHFSSTMIHFSLCQLNLHRCRHSIMLREMSD